MNIPQVKSYHVLKPYFAERKTVIFAGLFSLLAVDILQLLIPLIIKRVIDDLTIGAVTGRGLFRYALYILCAALFIGLFRFVWRRCLIGHSRRVEEGLRNRLFSHVQTLSSAYFDRTRTGELMAVATNDVQHVRMAVGMGMVALTDGIVLGLSAMGFMLYIDVGLTLLVLIPMPAIVLFARVLSRRLHRRYREVQASFGQMTEAVRESFAGIRVVKAYNGEVAAQKRVAGISKDYLRKNLGLVRGAGMISPGMMLFSNISMVILLYAGGRRVIDLTITPGDFVAFISYLGLLAWPMMAMGWVVNLLQRGAASLDRINEVLETRPGIVSPKTPCPRTDFAGDITFDNVSFRYRGDGPYALSRISFSVVSGQTLGVVGYTGSGKTTLCHLIPRLMDPAEGIVSIDGVDMRRIPVQTLRSHIVVVPQEPFLFSGSIRKNLCLGREHATREEITRAVRAADLYETIMEFPDQFDTVLGEKGITLSGGQRQRLALARAFLMSAPVMILDDPLNQVDTDTAASILDAIRTIARRRTTIMVSHRISHVRHADMIIVLKDGRIVERGAHEELMKTPGFYSSMYQRQQIEQESKQDANQLRIL